MGSVCHKHILAERTSETMKLFENAHSNNSYIFYTHFSNLKTTQLTTLKYAKLIVGLQVLCWHLCRKSTLLSPYTREAVGGVWDVLKSCSYIITFSTLQKLVLLVKYWGSNKLTFTVGSVGHKHIMAEHTSETMKLFENTHSNNSYNKFRAVQL